MPKIDWVWLVVGFALGYVLHLGFTHPRSPLAGAFSFYYGTDIK
jgi:hypothetical protein